MRLRQRDLKRVYIRPWIRVMDSEGSITNDYEEAYEVKASVQPLGGQLSASEYGESLKYILTMRLERLGNIKEKDGVCVYVTSSERPDYEVISIKRYDVPVLELKKRGV